MPGLRKAARQVVPRARPEELSGAALPGWLKARSEERGKLAIARKLLASGMSGEQVTEFTGLTAEQLEELK